VRRKGKALVLVVLCMMLVVSLAACSGKKEAATETKTPDVKSEGTQGTGTNTGNEKEQDSDVYPENGLPKNEKVTIKYAVWENGNGREWIDYAMDTFKKKFPNVSFDVTYSPTIDTITSTKIAANNDNDMFDLFSNFITGGGDAVLSLVKTGKIEPQDDLWDHKAYDNSGKTLKELQSGVYEGAQKIMGKMYALPSGQSIMGLFYNKALFEKNGWNQNPKTWSEFTALVDTIKEAGLIPITYPGKITGYLKFILGLASQYTLAEINGNLDVFNDIYKNNKSPYYTSPEVMGVYQRIYELGQKNAFPNGVAALTHTQSQMQLLQGQAAMAATGEWVQNEMKDSIPDGFQWGYMLIPMSDNPDDVKYYQSYLQGGHFIWAAKPELNKKWAKEFLVWTWNLDVQQIYAEKGGSIPVRSDYVNDPVLVEKLQVAPKAVLQYLKGNNVKGVIEARDVSLTDPNAEKARKLIEDDSMNDIALGKLDPAPKLQEAEKLLEKAIAAQK